MKDDRADESSPAARDADASSPDEDQVAPPLRPTRSSSRRVILQRASDHTRRSAGYRQRDGRSNGGMQPPGDAAPFLPLPLSPGAGDRTTVMRLLYLWLGAG
ncbi:unnamed protein product [Arctogadus glacialis]